MNLRDLAYLVAVADRRSFRQAAAACGVSQPTLSAQLKKLEAELGVSLFDRSVAPLAPTPVGERIIARARTVLAGVDEIRGEAALEAGSDGGVLKLGLFPTLGPYLLPHIVGSLRTSFPGLRLLVVEEKTSDLLAQLEAGSIDAAALALPVIGPGLHLEPLFHEEFVLAVPASHPLGGETGPVSPEDVAGTELVCLAEGHCLGDQVKEWIWAAGGHQRGDFRASSLESMRSMISAGTASTLLPALAIAPPVADAPGVTLRRFAGDAPGRDIALVWRASSPRSELLAKLAPALVPTDIADGLLVPLPKAVSAA